MVRLALVLLMLCHVANARAQTVRGVVTESDSKAPLQGVFIVLIDSAGQVRGGTLTNESGTFALRAPAAGSFHLRAERIGHRSTTSRNFVLLQDQTHTENITVEVAAIALAPIDVSSTRRCTGKESDGRAAQLWEEARKALTVTQWVARRASLEFERRSYVRTLQLRTLDVVSESASVAITRSLPYRSAPAEVLMLHGFVRELNGDTYYYGPDADVLLSDVFLEQHCFTTVTGKAETEGLVGLSFEPMRGRNLPDVRGTLWLDAATFELRYLDYRYTNLQRAYDTPETGGRTRFRKLPTGEWIVDGWYIRMPMLRQTLRQMVPYQYKEEGGEVIRIRDTRSSASLTDATGGVRGAVFDSVGAAPLSNALVYLSGTAFRARTDSSGAFQILNVPNGRYTIAFTHPHLESLPVLPSAGVVTVSGGVVSTVQLAVASPRTLLQSACPEQSTTANAGVLTGYVYDATDSNEAGVQLTVTYKSGNASTELRAQADHIGHYMVCGVPNNVLLTITAANEDGRDIRQVSLDNALFRRVDLSLKNAK